jgi:hypothetical protein
MGGDMGTEKEKGCAVNENIVKRKILVETEIGGEC